MTRLLAGILLSASLAFSQTVGVSLQGTVTDPSGALIPNATVEVRNARTGIAATLKTDEGGRYRQPLLQPGEYEVRVKAEGFQTSVRSSIALAVGQECVADFQLQVGSTNTEVTVAAQMSAVNTTSGALSGLVDQKPGMVVRPAPLQPLRTQALS